MSAIPLNWPKQSERYCEGLDDNGQWLPELALETLHNAGAIVDLGQIGPFVRRMLTRLEKQGVIVRYKGHFDTLQREFGIGPLKTIWAIPEIEIGRAHV